MNVSRYLASAALCIIGSMAHADAVLTTQVAVDSAGARSIVIDPHATLPLVQIKYGLVVKKAAGRSAAAILMMTMGTVTSQSALPAGCVAQQYGQSVYMPTSRRMTLSLGLEGKSCSEAIVNRFVSEMVTVQFDDAKTGTGASAGTVVIEVAAAKL